eukprot:UC1_evm1s1782
MAAPTLDFLFEPHPSRVVRDDIAESLGLGRRVLATESMEPGTRVMRECGLAVALETKTKSRSNGSGYAKTASAEEEGGGGGSTAATESTSESPRCGICFRFRAETFSEPCDMVADNAAAPQACCCSALLHLLAPVETGVVAEAALAVGAEHHVDSHLVRVWLRIAATCNAAAAAAAAEVSDVDATTTTTGENVEGAANLLPKTDRVRLEAWLASIRGVAELDTSMPNADWLVDVMSAAAGVWDVLPPSVRANTEAILLPSVAASPSGNQGVAGPEAFVVVAGQLNRNGYSLRDPLAVNSVVAFGLFPAVAMFNHSCAPNCAVVTHPDGRLEVRTLVCVAAGMELTVSYVDLLLPGAQRRAELKASKEFDCHCFRCTTPAAFEKEHRLSTPLCPHCRRNVPRLLPSPPEAGDSKLQYRCWTEDGGCSATVSQNDLDKVTTEANAMVDAVRSAEKPADKAVALQRIVKEAPGTLLPPEHEIMLRARLNLGSMLERAEAKEMRELCDENISGALEIMGKLLPPAWPEQTEWYIRLGCVRSAAAKTAAAAAPSEVPRLTKGAASAFASALKAARIFAGEDHPLIGYILTLSKQAASGDKVAAVSK